MWGLERAMCSWGGEGRGEAVSWGVSSLGAPYQVNHCSIQGRRYVALPPAVCQDKQNTLVTNEP